MFQSFTFNVKFESYKKLMKCSCICTRTNNIIKEILLLNIRETREAIWSKLSAITYLDKWSFIRLEKMLKDVYNCISVMLDLFLKITPSHQELCSIHKGPPQSRKKVWHFTLLKMTQICPDLPTLVWNFTLFFWLRRSLSTRYS